MSNAPPDEVRRIGHDPQAFTAFYLEHLEVVQRFVARRVSDPYLAADLTVDVFLAAIDSADSYRAERGVPVAWLVGIARNIVGAEFRRAARDRELVRRISGRALMELVSVDGLSVAEAAAVLGVKPGTARVRLHRSRLPNSRAVWVRLADRSLGDLHHPVVGCRQPLDPAHHDGGITDRVLRVAVPLGLLAGNGEGCPHHAVASAPENSAPIAPSASRSAR